MPGPRDPELTPYVIEIERAAVAGKHKRIVMVTGAQSGKTEALLDLIGQRLDQRPAPVLYVGPNKQFIREQFEPRVMSLLTDSPSLLAKVASDKRMTQTRKIVAGVPLRLAHAGSSSALKSDPAVLALVDEYDDMLKNVKGQGDPLGLVERRGDTFADFVCVVTSTPGKGMVEAVTDKASGLAFWDMAKAEDIESRIWSLWQQGSRHHWAWPCPHCSEYFIPRFSCLRFPNDATPMAAGRATFLECPRCGGVIEEHHKADMNARGRYVAPGQVVTPDGTITGEAHETPTLSFWVSGLASPFVSFGDRVTTYLEALAIGDDAMVQTAMSAGFGELHAPGGGTIKEWQQVAKRRLPHKFGEVPLEAVKLTAAVDVQGNGFFYSIRAWGARASSWQVESGEIAGHTNEPEVWNDLANVLLQHYGDMPISLALIDSGFRPNKPDEGPTNVVYDFCRRFRRFCRPTKGYDTLTAPCMRGKTKVTIPGSRFASTLELVRLDTDFWKQRLHERLSWPEDQPGGFFLSADASDDYCKQLVSEVRKVTPTGKPMWIQINRRNHYFDCEAMNEAAGHLLAVQKIPVGTSRAGDEMPDEDEPPPITPTPTPKGPPAPPPVSSARALMANYAARLNQGNR